MNNHQGNTENKKEKRRFTARGKLRNYWLDGDDSDGDGGFDLSSFIDQELITFDQSTIDYKTLRSLQEQSLQEQRDHNGNNPANAHEKNYDFERGPNEKQQLGQSQKPAHPLDKNAALNGEPPSQARTPTTSSDPQVEQSNEKNLELKMQNQLQNRQQHTPSTPAPTPLNK